MAPEQTSWNHERLFSDMRPEIKHFLRLLLLIGVVLAIPIVPFLVFGDALEARFTGWLDATLPAATVAILVAGLLAVDLLLPVPSSLVSTFAGKMLGFWGGLTASWCGMTLGAVVAFGLVKAFGRPVVGRLTGEEELQRVDSMARRYGFLVLVVARPVPVLAEASVLLMGATDLAWGRFLAAVGLSNAGIAAVYAALGDAVALPVALGASLALPLLLGGVAGWLWPREHQDA
jgi:uncharacterized membrane protein YdjX (TVP38/TMEM64 family)